MTDRIEGLVPKALLLLLLLLAGFFFRHFLVPSLAALIIGFATWPLYAYLKTRLQGRETLSATLAILAVTLTLIIPLLIAFVFAVAEVRQWAEWLIEANREGAALPDWLGSAPGIGPFVAPYWEKHLAHPGALGELVRLASGEQLGSLYRWLRDLGGATFHSLLMLVFMLITLFFVYKDGSQIVCQLDRAGHALMGERWGRLSRIVPATVSSTVTGMLLVAIGEGVVLGVAYWVVNLPSPVALGLLTGFMALIPGGAPLAFSMASAYLAATGEVTAGVGLFLWGSIELFIVDKTIRPRLVGGPIRLPFLPTFFGLIGGVMTMGLIGLFIGPVLMAMLVAIWREWVNSLQP